MSRGGCGSASRRVQQSHPRPGQALQPRYSLRRKPRLRWKARGVVGTQWGWAAQGGRSGSGPDLPFFRAGSIGCDHWTMPEVVRPRHSMEKSICIMKTTSRCALRAEEGRKQDEMGEHTSVGGQFGARGSARDVWRHVRAILAIALRVGDEKWRARRTICCKLPKAHQKLTTRNSCQRSLIEQTRVS